MNTTAVAFNTLPIIAGNRYQLTATISTRTQVERALPEPGTLALVGLDFSRCGNRPSEPKARLIYRPLQTQAEGGGFTRLFFAPVSNLSKE